MRDMSAAIKRLSKQGLDVKRYPNGAFVAGIWMPSTNPVSTLKMRCSVQPVPGKIVELLDEGVRARARYVVYTAEVAQVLGMADTTTYKGDEYQFTTVKDWSDQGNYYQYVLLRLETGT